MAYQQLVNLYDPIDIQSAQWKAGMTARDVGDQMERARNQMYAASAGPDPERVAASDQQNKENELMRREQERREYDSMTARMGQNQQSQKMGVLSGLLSGGGVGGAFSQKRTYGGPAPTASPRSPRYGG